MGVEGPLISAIVIPTHDSAVAETYKILRRLRNGLVPLVDGDLDGNMKVEELRTVAEPPNLVLQWRDAWAIEDTIGWVLKASAIRGSGLSGSWRVFARTRQACQKGC